RLHATQILLERACLREGVELALDVADFAREVRHREARLRHLPSERLLLPSEIPLLTPERRLLAPELVDWRKQRVYLVDRRSIRNDERLLVVLEPDKGSCEPV